MGISASEIQKLYIAYFNRPADPLGLAYWENQAALNGGSTAAIANAFSASAEYKSLYDGKSSAQIVNALYLNLFGRPAEAAGLDFWVTRLDNQTLNVGNIAFAILSGAQNSDRLVVENKATAAAQFTTNVNLPAEITAYSSAAASAIAKAWLAAVTDTPASLNAALSSVDSTIASIVALSAPVSPGGDTPTPLTLTLTAGTDNLTGGEGADLFIASAATLQAGDSLDGRGGFDVLSVTNTATLVGTLTSIEEIRIADFSTLSVTATALGTVAVGHGATTDVGDATLFIDLAFSAAFDLSRITAGQAGTATSATKALYTNKATTASNVTLTGLADNFTGTANADTINGGGGNDTINGAGGTDTINGGAGNDRITYATADADNVNGGADTDTLVVTGGTLTIDLTAAAGAITNFEVIDVSAVTGALVVNVNTNAATTTAFTVTGSSLADTITTGAGNDIISMGLQGQTIAYDTIVAAGGNDTLVMIGNITTGTASQNVIDLSAAGDQLTTVNNNAEGVNQSGFENVSLARIVPGTGVGFTITAHAGGSKIAGTSLGDVITGGAGDDTIYGFSSSDVVNGGGGNNTLVLINNSDTTSLFTMDNVPSSLTIGTDGALTGIQNITLSGTISTTLTLSGQSEAFTISASTATVAETIVAGSGNDTITGSSLADFIEGGLGADTLTGGLGADEFRFGANGSVHGVARDIVTDFAAGIDKLAFATTAVLQAADASPLGAGSNVQQSAGGLVTFHATDNTLALKIAAVQADIQLDAVNSLAFFVDSGNTYVYFAGNATGNADDMIIQLTGVTTLTTITAGATSTIA
jgi:Ca2+-binding RTX toxin-like protein